MNVIAYDLKGAGEATGLSVRALQYAIENGYLVAHYGGEKNTKPLIRAEDLDRYIKALPTTRKAS
jgi:hypothetical protein